MNRREALTKILASLVLAMPGAVPTKSNAAGKKGGFLILDDPDCSNPATEFLRRIGGVQLEYAGKLFPVIQSEVVTYSGVSSTTITVASLVAK